MRVKDFWGIFPLPAMIKLVWDRLTLTRTTTVYFVFSILHCAVQVIFQVNAFQTNVLAVDFLASITKQGNAVDSNGFYVFGNALRFCDRVPKSLSASSCKVIWDRIAGNETSIALTMNATTGVSPVTTTTTNPDDSVMHDTSSFYSSSVPAGTQDTRSWDQNELVYNENAVDKWMPPNTIEAVEVDGTSWNKESVILNKECLSVLGWLVQILQNTKREDLVFIMFQIWMLGMSIVAILNESVPHTIATLLTHLVATGWTGFRTFSTIRFRCNFAELTAMGACQSIDLLQSYWQSRSDAELSSLVLNSVALLISAFLSWQLMKSFSWQTFKRVGASRAISRTYKTVLTLSIVIQLSLFFILTSIALWLDQLWNGAIGHLATSPLYRPFLIVTLILLPVWLAFGWYSVRREKNIETLIFLTMCCGYLAGWGAMFDSFTFRWTYMTWPFFAAMTTASVFLTLLTLILGIMCHFNFGKGLRQYLKTHEPVEEGFEAVIVDAEKANFPLNKEPTFSVAFDSGMQLPFQPQAPAQNTAQPIGIVSQVTLSQPSPAVTRTSSSRIRCSRSPKTILDVYRRFSELL